MSKCVYFIKVSNFESKVKKCDLSRSVTKHFVMRDHSIREIQRATLIPSIRDIKWHTLFLTVVFPELLFISARTPATAMYMNPPAVNPYKISVTNQTFKMSL